MNAAIVPAGVNGSISAYATADTELIIDISGYFIPAGGSPNLAFYPAAPCRIGDTRLANGSFGGPTMSALETRTFSVPNANCGIPHSARAYSLNMTVVPKGRLSYLTTWPSGQPQPFVSTLNAMTGMVTANAAIVPARSDGSINVFVTDPTDVIIDINGYFAPPGLGNGLLLYALTPCRITDTRYLPGPTAGPSMQAGESRTFNFGSTLCGLQANAKAYSLNATVVPKEPLSFLTLWPAGGGRPLASTLNSFDAAVVANAAIFPVADFALSAFVTGLTDLILDVNGYFAP